MPAQSSPLARQAACSAATAAAGAAGPPPAAAAQAPQPEAGALQGGQGRAARLRQLWRRHPRAARGRVADHAVHLRCAAVRGQPPTSAASLHCGVPNVATVSHLHTPMAERGVSALPTPPVIFCIFCRIVLAQLGGGGEGGDLPPTPDYLFLRCGGCDTGILLLLLLAWPGPVRSH